jgi:hypothetical protein
VPKYYYCNNDTCGYKDTIDDDDGDDNDDDTQTFAHDGYDYNHHCY